MTATCPSDLALEAHLLAPATSALGPHLASCSRCTARLATMERQGADFRRIVCPATIERIEEAAGRRSRRFWLLAPVPALAAAALAVFLLRPAGPNVGPDDETQLKGVTGGLGLTIFAKGDSGARPLFDGARLSSRAVVRFRVRSAEPCRLYVFSVDAAGQVSKLHPAAAGPAEITPGAHDVEGGAALDGKPGPERFYAICAGTLPWPEIAGLARAAAGGGPEALRRGEALSGAAAKLAQASVLVEKDPP